jgi:hypothetical protein
MVKTYDVFWKTSKDVLSTFGTNIVSNDAVKRHLICAGPWLCSATPIPARARHFHLRFLGQLQASGMFWNF